MIKRTMFTTSLFEETDFLNNEEINSTIEHIKKNETFGQHASLPNAGGVSSHISDKSVDLLDRMPELKTRIEKKLVECSLLMGGYENIKISNSWSNIQKKGSRLKHHCHPNSIISGVIFLNVDVDSSKLYFDNPNKFVRIFDYKDATSDNYEFYSFNPVKGQMLMWPSYLFHGSYDDLNNTENRMVLSFNSYYEKVE
tara:strand:+ start:408 stop:998 length:591 start_codon:yes stop_codon:yes gene_type:complete